MKKVIILSAVMLMGLTTATAAETKSATLNKDLDITSRYLYVQPILFVERGVEFLIFADGSFDFNTDFIGNATRPNYNRNRRRNANRSFGAPGRIYRHKGARGVRITHDYLGRVRRIGKVFVNYDKQGRIKRIGSVFMRYKFNRLQSVGDLRLQYNRRGRLIGSTGFVNLSNQNCGFCEASTCSINHFDTNRPINAWDNNNDNFYYYRKNGKVKKHKKLKRHSR